MSVVIASGVYERTINLSRSWFIFLRVISLVLIITENPNNGVGTVRLVVIVQVVTYYYFVLYIQCSVSFLNRYHPCKFNIHNIQSNVECSQHQLDDNLVRCTQQTDNVHTSTKHYTTQAIKNGNVGSC